MHQPSPLLNLLLLPNELLLGILRNLECQDLLNCTLVCRLLRDVIRDASELLYAIELHKSGMIDTGRAPLAYVDRLTALKDRCRAWRELDWKKVVRIDIEGSCTAYELVGGVFAKSSGRDLFFSWLPSARSPGHIVHHQNVGLLLRDFAIDPTQDLVVLLEEDGTLFQEDWSRNVWLHLRTMSTMEPHPKARSPQLLFSVRHIPSANRIAAAFVQIASDVLAVFISLGLQTTRLIMWNWEDGRILGDLGEDEINPASWDFALTSPRSFMITTTQDDGEIMLYRFSHPHETWPVHAATLHFPPLKDSYTVASLSSHSGPFLACPPQGTIFTTGPDSRIQVISACYQDRNVPFGNVKCYFFYLHNRTLQKYIEQYEFLEGALGRTPVEPIDVPWEEWGPENCHYNLVRSQTHWLRYAHGGRIVCPPEFRDGHGVMQIWDFNTIPDGMFPRSKRASEGPTGSGIPFRQSVTANLPYRSECRTVEEAYRAFMIDEERVIGLKADFANEEDIVGLHVYCF